jgi:hypothetical protein
MRQRLYQQVPCAEIRRENSWIWLIPLAIGLRLVLRSEVK